MRPSLLVLAFAALSYVPFDAEAEGLEHRIEISHGRIVGYLPGAVVRPGGDETVRDIPAAVSRTGVDLHLAFVAVEADFRPFMLNVADKNGPKVVGLHYEVMIVPFACQKADEGTWDWPWENPCVAIGYAHRSEHNQDDGTYRWTYGNGVLGKIRVWSRDQGKSQYWLWAQWVASGAETPFALTAETDTVASRLENRLVLFGTNSTMLVGERGRFTGAAEFRVSKEGVASFGKTLGYHHDVVLGINDDTSFTLRFGLEVGAEYNFRKKEEVGDSSYRLMLVATLPLSG